MAELADWRPEVLVVVGGTLWETERAPDIRALLNEQFQRGATTAGICGGTLALARAGLLNGRAHTSNDAGFLTRHAEGYTGQRHFVASAAAVVDDRVITAPGSAPVSFTAAVFSAAGWMKRRCASSAPCWRRSTRWKPLAPRRAARGGLLLRLQPGDLFRPDIRIYRFQNQRDIVETRIAHDVAEHRFADVALSRGCGGGRRGC